MTGSTSVLRERAVEALSRQGLSALSRTRDYEQLEHWRDWYLGKDPHSVYRTLYRQVRRLPEPWRQDTLRELQRVKERLLGQYAQRIVTLVFREPEPVPVVRSLDVPRGRQLGVMACTDPRCGREGTVQLSVLTFRAFRYICARCGSVYHVDLHPVTSLDGQVPVVYYQLKPWRNLREQVA